jgi:hypothetical protein
MQGLNPPRSPEEQPAESEEKPNLLCAWCQWICGLPTAFLIMCLSSPSGALAGTQQAPGTGPGAC